MKKDKLIIFIIILSISMAVSIVKVLDYGNNDMKTNDNGSFYYATQVNVSKIISETTDLRQFDAPWNDPKILNHLINTMRR